MKLARYDGPDPFAGSPLRRDSLTPLERYGQHDDDCKKRAGVQRYYGQLPCSCGLDEALADQRVGS